MVRQIFAWVGQERLTLAGVCRRLLEAGIPSPTGQAHWSRAMVHTLLLNPAYAGRAVYGRRRCVPWRAPLRPPRGHSGVPRRPWRQVPAPPEQHIGVPVPAIIDEALFAAAAEQLEENRRRSRERLAGVQYLLRGLLVCQKCGYAFIGYNPKPWRYYRCCGTDRNRFHGQLRCDARLLAVEPLETAVWGSRHCRERSAGSCGTRRASWKSIGDAWTRSRAAPAGTSSTPRRARATSFAMRSIA